MNKRQEKKRRKLNPTYSEWLSDLFKKIAEIFDIDPNEQADVEEVEIFLEEEAR